MKYSRVEQNIIKNTTYPYEREREKENSLYIKQTKNQEQKFLPAFINVLKKNLFCIIYFYTTKHI